MQIQTAKGNIELARGLFWEIDESAISKALLEADEWVILRVFEYGTLDEISDIINYYGQENTLAILLKLKGELKPMTRALARLYFRTKF
jgi:hypothetical protein